MKNVPVHGILTLTDDG